MIAQARVHSVIASSLTAGWSAILLAGFYTIFDVLGWRKAAYPLTLFGVNSILIYLSDSLFDWKYTTMSLFGQIVHALPSGWQPLAGIIALLGLKLLFLHWLYKKKVFLKV